MKPAYGPRGEAGVDYTLKYGHGELRVQLPSGPGSEVEVCQQPERSVTAADEQDIVGAALSKPIKSRPLADIVVPGERVCIVTSDNTRPMPSSKVLPGIIDSLFRAGVEPGDIQIVFALGIHRKQSTAEQRELLGPQIPDELRAIDSDPEDTVFLGRTPQGTPVHVFRPVARADRVICIGNVEFHYFAGYSGGAKAILPGVCSAETVEHNHRMMLDCGARAGKIEGNPVRQDIDSVLELLSVDFIVNVALSGEGQIAYAAAGHPVAAHRDVCGFVDRVNRKGSARRSNLVIASAGGHPKDVNLYQAQKAMDFACQFAADDAPVLCLGECSEGYGNETFAEWLRNTSSLDDVAARLHAGFELGGHKAYALARSTHGRTVGLVSSLPEPAVRDAFLHPVSIDDNGVVKIPAELMTSAVQTCSDTLHIAILPEAASILPTE